MMSCIYSAGAKWHKVALLLFVDAESLFRRKTTLPHAKIEALKSLAIEKCGNRALEPFANTAQSQLLGG